MTGEDLPQDIDSAEVAQDLETGDPADDPQPVEAAPPPAPPRDRDGIIAALIARGTRKDKACLYADAFLAYQEANQNIIENGCIVLHPRTAAPVENPYLRLRERALKQLLALKNAKAEFLW